MNCKPHDLAIVIRADAVPELIGQIVEVMHESLIDTPYGLIWLVRFQTPKVFPGLWPGSAIVDITTFPTR
uniref:hypothetical protein n=1 Tax=Cupriavidus taiwanensis TaxID=164546 RepID=UPI000E2FD569|nr:hypothetical protein [Cupriavidus taiwanensis]